MELHSSFTIPQWFYSSTAVLHQLRYSGLKNTAEHLLATSQQRCSVSTGASFYSNSANSLRSLNLSRFFHSWVEFFFATIGRTSPFFKASVFLLCLWPRTRSKPQISFSCSDSSDGSDRHRDLRWQAIAIADKSTTTSLKFILAWRTCCVAVELFFDPFSAF